MDDTHGRFVTGENKEELEAIFRKVSKFTDKVIEGRMSDLDGVFCVGETLSVRGSRFVVKSLTEDGQMVLQLMPRTEAS